MKKRYESPELETIRLELDDIIKTSGLESPKEDDPFGDWEI